MKKKFDPNRRGIYTAVRPGLSSQTKVILVTVAILIVWVILAWVLIRS